MTDIILVHGAGHSGNCWEKVEPLLKAKGFSPHSVTLSGHGDRRMNAWRVTMKRYAGDVIALAETLPGPSVLVGHSMGGFVISQAAELRPELFSKLIYLTAMVPKREPSAVIHMPRPPRAMAKGGKPRLIRGTIEFPGQLARNVIYSGTPTDVTDGVEKYLCPQPLRPNMNKVTLTEARYGQIPRYYIECTEDRVIPIADQRTMQAHWPMKAVETIATDHMPNVSAPGEVAEIIGRLAA